MRYTIRKGIFETNSSSMHTVAITDDNTRMTDREIREEVSLTRDGVWDLSHLDNQFGWGYDELYSLGEKVLYAIASLCNCGYNYDAREDYNMVLNTIKEKVPNIEKIALPENPSCFSDMPYGTIDHQSSGLLKNFLSNNDISLEDFLFDRKYAIIITNDNSSEPYRSDHINGHKIKTRNFGESLRSWEEYRKEQDYWNGVTDSKDSKENKDNNTEKKDDTQQSVKMDLSNLKDSIDLSSLDIINEVMTTSEAGKRWGLTAQAIKLACKGQKGYKPRFTEKECRKSGSSWLVTKEGMERLYGKEPK